MFVTNHVLAGAALGALVRRPLLAVPVGVASHLAMDRLPHWGAAPGEDFLPTARRDGLIGLAAVALTVGLARPDRRLAVLGGVAGAVAPDLDKPARHFFGGSPWPEPFDEFHSEIQNEAPHRGPQELAVAAALAGIALALGRRG
jgi:hypothetical protein